MIEITIKITPEVERRLRTAYQIRQMAGTSAGLLDDFVGALMDKIRAGVTEWEPRLRPETKGDNR